MSQPHYDVLIATPGSSMEADYVKSLVKTINYLNSKNISYLYLNEYSSQVSIAREATVMGSRFLDAFNPKPLSGEVSYNKIFWIDSDIAWELDDFIKLYESDKEIVSGIYLNFQGIPMVTFKEEQSFEDVLTSGELTEIEAVGFGFICVSKGVFESMPRPWFGSKFQEIDDGKGNKMSIPFGEDYSWCYKARECGFSIFLDPQVILTHYKTVPISIQKEIKK